MPIYEYICMNCNNKFEILVFSKEDIECKFCGSKELQRIMSTFFSSNPTGEKSSSPCSTCRPTPTKCSSCSLK